MDVCRNQWLCQKEPSRELTGLTTAVLAITVSLLTFIVWSQLRLMNEFALQGIVKKEGKNLCEWQIRFLQPVPAGADQPLAEALCFLRPCCSWFSRVWDFISSSWAQANVKRCPRLIGKLGAACFSCPIWLDLDQQDLPKRWNKYFPGKIGSHFYTCDLILNDFLRPSEVKLALWTQLKHLCRETVEQSWCSLDMTLGNWKMYVFRQSWKSIPLMALSKLYTLEAKLLFKVWHTLV